MSKIKIAILEDTLSLLQELKRNLEKTGLVEVVAIAIKSDDFIQKVNTEKPDAIVVDIELPGDNMNGMDVANFLKLPTLFVSGNMKDYLDRYVELNLNPEVIAEILTKTATTAKIQAILPKFIDRVVDKKRKRSIELKLSGEASKMIDTDSIVYLKTEGVSSGNLEIYFDNRPPGILVNFALKKIDEWDTETVFLKINGSERVNKSRITERSSTEIWVDCIDNGGNKVERKLNISEGFQPTITQAFRS